MVTATNEMGSIEITEEVVAKIAGRCIERCYGVVGMAARKTSDGWVELLNRENYARGVQVTSKDGKLTISLYIIIQYGTSIHAVCESAMSTVKYEVEKFTGMPVSKVNITVEGIRV
ncbi:MAG: Asp23/Gls24 family envelope stress response protein [Christensenellales bacterium]|jgi:uncharacterized alkaline shock family protein YloU